MKIKSIEEMEGKIKLDMGLGQWYIVHKFGIDFIIDHSYSMAKDDKIRSLAKDYIKGYGVKELLKKYGDTKFTLSSWCRV